MKLFVSKSKVDAFGMHDNRSVFCKVIIGNVPPQTESCGLQFEFELQSTGIEPLTKHSPLKCPSPTSYSFEMKKENVQSISTLNEGLYVYLYIVLYESQLTCKQ